MSTGLIQSGASPRETASAVAQRARENAAAARAGADRMRAGGGRAIEPPNRPADAPADVRAEVMSERGLDRVALLRLPPLARIAAEISITAEAAARAQMAEIRTTGSFIDLRV